MRSLSKYSLAFASVLVLHAGEPQEYKQMPSDRWGDIKFLETHQYPQMAGIAKIQGETISWVIIDSKGLPTKAKMLVGPPQLGYFTETSIIKLRFAIKDSDGPGPWIFFITAKFDLNTKTVTFKPTPQELIPVNLMKKTTK